MRSLFLLSLLAASAPVLAQPPAPAPAADSTQTVTVTGQRLEDFRDRLAACLARHCPVNEDVDATMALSEFLFLRGDYSEAREAVNASLHRNHDQAAAFPEPIADLYRAQGRISRHMGYDDQAARSTNQILRSLNAGIPQEDYRQFTARLERADLQMAMANVTQARRELGNLEREAHEAGREDVVTLAHLRRLWFDLVVDPRSSARHELQRMAQASDPSQRMGSIGAHLLLARLARFEGDSRRADALLAEVGRIGNDTHRVLLISPPYQLLQQEPIVSGGSSLSESVAASDVLSRISENFNGKWIDVGFWVMPDGSVSGLEVVRKGAPYDWANPLLVSIRHRLYSTGREATYRLERYTYTSPWSDFDHQVTGSHMRQRLPGARVEYLDLTTEMAPPVPAATAIPATPNSAPSHPA